MTAVIIGAGAAGCFAAIELKRRQPAIRVILLEAAGRALAKVAITGGGRCNLTNTFARVPQQANGLKEVYPRGAQLMRRALSAFSHEDCWEWFEREGVRLVAQDDECVFPRSQDAMQIVGTLLRLVDQLGVELRLRHRVAEVRPAESGYAISFADVSIPELQADAVLVTVGGKPTERGFSFLSSFGLKLETPVPSLFTFNIEGDWTQRLMGAVVEHAAVTLAGTKFKAAGPLLLTHWGMSGPAILRLSSYAARHLAAEDYRGRLVVNWLGGANDEEARQLLRKTADANPRKLITSTPPQGLTARFWASLLERYGLAQQCPGGSPLRWLDLGKKQFSRLVTALTADEHTITGRCAFKEEFVTCGGVALSEVNPSTMEARRYPGLFFAGEVLDIDALTGGFNLQAAWSTAYVAAQNIAKIHVSI